MMAANLQVSGKGMLGILMMLILSPQALSQCDHSIEIKNGKIQTFDDYYYKIFCKDGYRTNGDPIQRCSDGVVQVYCEEIQCRNLTHLHNGTVSPKGNISIGDSVSIECNSGYILMGPKTLKCGRDGEWQPYDMLFCMPLVCPTMFHFPNGQKDPHELHGPGTMTFTCNKGFKLRGPSMLDCTSNGTWVPNVMPFCEKISCCALPSVKNGTFFPSGEADIGTNGTLKCHEGFVIDGQEEFYCDESGNWTFPHTPSCKEKSDNQLQSQSCPDQLECAEMTGCTGWIALSIALIVVVCISIIASAIAFCCWKYKPYKKGHSQGSPGSNPPPEESRPKGKEPGRENEEQPLTTLHSEHNL